jgi:hypothetical protein
MVMLGYLNHLQITAMEKEKTFVPRNSYSLQAKAHCFKQKIYIYSCAFVLSLRKKKKKSGVCLSKVMLNFIKVGFFSSFPFVIGIGEYKSIQGTVHLSSAT